MKNNICVFLLDNFDSFTYNLVDELRGMGLELIIYRNSVSAALIFDKMREKAQHTNVLLMLSPGPGTPSEAGCMLDLIKLVQGKFPVLGICLGHQAIVEHHGGSVIRAEKVMHGKSSLIEHSQTDIFADMPNPLPVARYHSLMGANMPAELDVLAQIQNVPMTVLNRHTNMLGFQFHPESILTAQGTQLLRKSVDFLLGAVD